MSTETTPTSSEKSQCAEGRQEEFCQIVGEWKFVGMEYQGEISPPRDQRLDLRYRFDADHKSWLYWSYDAGKTFCERFGQYELQGDLLIDEVLLVNAGNMSSCSSDPDMQTGRRSFSRIELKDDQLRLRLPFGENEIVYIFEEIP